MLHICTAGGVFIRWPLRRGCDWAISLCSSCRSCTSLCSIVLLWLRCLMLVLDCGRLPATLWVKLCGSVESKLLLRRCLP